MAAAVCRAANDRRAEQDIVYTKAGSVELKLDLARPAEVMTDHFSRDRRDSRRGLASGKQGRRAGRILPQFARRKYVAISPQYRFCPKDAFPAQVHDVKAAVRWLKSNAKKYKIDPEHELGHAIGFRPADTWP